MNAEQLFSSPYRSPGHAAMLWRRNVIAILTVAVTLLPNARWVVAASPTSAPATQATSGEELMSLMLARDTADRLMTLRIAMIRYVRDHGGNPPLSELVDWSALLHLTDRQGARVDGDGFGPYLREVYRNPYTGKSTVCDLQHLVPTAGWAIDLGKPKSLLIAVIPPSASQASQGLLRSHLAVVCMESRLIGVRLFQSGVFDRTSMASYEEVKRKRWEHEAELAYMILYNAMLAYTFDRQRPPSIDELGSGSIMGEFLSDVPANPLMGNAKRIVPPGKSDYSCGWTYNEQTTRLHLVVPKSYAIPDGWRARDMAEEVGRVSNSSAATAK